MLLLFRFLFVLLLFRCTTFGVYYSLGPFFFIFLFLLSVRRRTYNEKLHKERKFFMVLGKILYMVRKKSQKLFLIFIWWNEEEDVSLQSKSVTARVRRNLRDALGRGREK